MKRTRKAKEGTKHLSRETIENDDSTGDDESPSKNANDDDKSLHSNANKDDDKKKGAKKEAVKRESKKKKNISGPLHITANNEPVAIGVIGDLDPTIFNQVSVGAVCPRRRGVQINGLRARCSLKR